MRKILMFTRNGIAAIAAITRRASLAAFTAGLAVTICCFSNATAQTLQQLAPTAMSLGDTPVTGNRFVDSHPVNATYSIAEGSSQLSQSSVQPASYLGQRARAALQQAESPRGMACGPGCDISWYLSYEALWLRRENDERFSLTQNYTMPDFDYDFGGRYTIGRLYDCVNAWEAVYAGPYKWDRTLTVADPGNLQSNFSVPAAPTLLDAFDGADVHAQAWQAKLNSFELNRRWWTWDVVSTMLGVRYVDYEENYALSSAHATNGSGLFRERVTNRMLGAQFGADLIYPVSLRSNVGIRGKAGVYANFDERSTFLSNGGALILNTGQDDVDVAGVIEMGVFTNYQIVPSVRLTAGYEFWYLPGMATVPEQGPSIITAASGTTVYDSADLFLHGGSVGVQVLY